jgi:hypothetical protein
MMASVTSVRDLLTEYRSELAAAQKPRKEFEVVSVHNAEGFRFIGTALPNFSLLTFDAPNNKLRAQWFVENFKLSEARFRPPVCVSKRMFSDGMRIGFEAAYRESPYKWAKRIEDASRDMKANVHSIEKTLYGLEYEGLNLFSEELSKETYEHASKQLNAQLLDPSRVRDTEPNRALRDIDDWFRTRDTRKIAFDAVANKSIGPYCVLWNNSENAPNSGTDTPRVYHTFYLLSVISEHKSFMKRAIDRDTEAEYIGPRYAYSEFPSPQTGANTPNVRIIARVVADDRSDRYRTLCVFAAHRNNVWHYMRTAILLAVPYSETDYVPNSSYEDFAPQIIEYTRVLDAYEAWKQSLLKSGKEPTRHGFSGLQYVYGEEEEEVEGGGTSTRQKIGLHTTVRLIGARSESMSAEEELTTEDIPGYIDDWFDRTTETFRAEMEYGPTPLTIGEEDEYAVIRGYPYWTNDLVWYVPEKGGPRRAYWVTGTDSYASSGKSDFVLLSAHKPYFKREIVSPNDESLQRIEDQDIPDMREGWHRDLSQTHWKIYCKELSNSALFDGLFRYVDGKGNFVFCIRDHTTLQDKYIFRINPNGMEAALYSTYISAENKNNLKVKQKSLLQGVVTRTIPYPAAAIPLEDKETFAVSVDSTLTANPGTRAPTKNNPKNRLFRYTYYDPSTIRRTRGHVRIAVDEPGELQEWTFLTADGHVLIGSNVVVYDRARSNKDEDTDMFPEDLLQFSLIPVADTKLQQTFWNRWAEMAQHIPFVRKSESEEGEGAELRTIHRLDESNPLVTYVNFTNDVTVYSGTPSDDTELSDVAFPSVDELSDGMRDIISQELKNDRGLYDELYAELRNIHVTFWNRNAVVNKTLLVKLESIIKSLEKGGDQFLPNVDPTERTMMRALLEQFLCSISGSVISLSKHTDLNAIPDGKEADECFRLMFHKPENALRIQTRIDTSLFNVPFDIIVPRKYEPLNVFTYTDTHSRRETTDVYYSTKKSTMTFENKTVLDFTYDNSSVTAYRAEVGSRVDLCINPDDILYRRDVRKALIVEIGLKRIPYIVAFDESTQQSYVLSTVAPAGYYSNVPLDVSSARDVRQRKAIESTLQSSTIVESRGEETYIKRKGTSTQFVGTDASHMFLLNTDSDSLSSEDARKLEDILLGRTKAKDTDFAGIFPLSKWMWSYLNGIADSDLGIVKVHPSARSEWDGQLVKTNDDGNLFIGVYIPHLAGRYSRNSGIFSAIDKSGLRPPVKFTHLLRNLDSTKEFTVLGHTTPTNRAIAPYLRKIEEFERKYGGLTALEGAIYVEIRPEPQEPELTYLLRRDAIDFSLGRAIGEETAERYGEREISAFLLDADESYLNRILYGSWLRVAYSFGAIVTQYEITLDDSPSEAKEKIENIVRTIRDSSPLFDALASPTDEKGVVEYNRTTVKMQIREDGIPFLRYANKRQDEFLSHIKTTEVMKYFELKEAQPARPRRLVPLVRPQEWFLWTETIAGHNVRYLGVNLTSDPAGYDRYAFFSRNIEDDRAPWELTAERKKGEYDRKLVVPASNEELFAKETAAVNPELQKRMTRATENPIYVAHYQKEKDGGFREVVDEIGDIRWNMETGQLLYTVSFRLEGEKRQATEERLSSVESTIPGPHPVEKESELFVDESPRIITASADPNIKARFDMFKRLMSTSSFAHPRVLYEQANLFIVVFSAKRDTATLTRRIIHRTTNGTNEMIIGLDNPTDPSANPPLAMRNVLKIMGNPRVWRVFDWENSTGERIRKFYERLGAQKTHTLGISKFSRGRTRSGAPIIVEHVNMDYERFSRSDLDIRVPGDTVDLQKAVIARLVDGRVISQIAGISNKSHKLANSIIATYPYTKERKVEFMALEHIDLDQLRADPRTRGEIIVVESATTKVHYYDTDEGEMVHNAELKHDPWELYTPKSENTMEEYVGLQVRNAQAEREYSIVTQGITDGGEFFEGNVRIPLEVAEIVVEEEEEEEEEEEPTPVPTPTPTPPPPTPTPPPREPSPPPPPSPVPTPTPTPPSVPGEELVVTAYAKDVWPRVLPPIPPIDRKGTLSGSRFDVEFFLDSSAGARPYLIISGSGLDSLKPDYDPTHKNRFYLEMWKRQRTEEFSSAGLRSHVTYVSKSRIAGGKAVLRGNSGVVRMTITLPSQQKYVIVSTYKTDILKFTTAVDNTPVVFLLTPNLRTTNTRAQFGGIVTTKLERGLPLIDLRYVRFDVLSLPVFKSW